MRIDGVDLNFFMSHEHTELEFGKGLWLVQGNNRDNPSARSNGSGKSAIFDGLEYAPFGETTRGLRADDVVSTFAKNTDRPMARIRLTDDNGKKAVIERSRRPNGLKFIYDGKDLTCGTDKLTQERIEKFLGMTHRTFCSTILFGQSAPWDFTTATDKEQKEIFSEIMGVNLEQALTTAKQAKAELESQAASSQVRIGSLDEQVEDLSKKDYTKEREEFEESRQEQVRSLKKTMKAHLVDAGYDTTVHPDMKLVSELQSEIDGVSTDRKKSGTRCKFEREKISAELSSVDQEISQKVYARSTNRRRIKSFEGLTGGQCPECDNKVTEKHATEVCRRLQSENDSFTADIFGLEQKQKKLKRGIKNLDDDRDESEAKAQKRIDHLNARINAMKSAIMVKKRITEKKNEKNPWDDVKDDNEARIRELRTSRDVTSACLLKTQELTAYYDFWIVGYGDRGVKSFIFDSIVGDLTDRANEYIGLMTDGQIKVEFDTQTHLKSGDIREKFEIKIHTSKGVLPFRHYSGGEKRRISLGINLALSDLIAARNSKSFDFLVLDEVFEGLDATGRRCVMSLLKKLGEKKRTILVVSHDSEFASNFDRVITVTKIKDRSKVND